MADLNGPRLRDEPAIWVSSNVQMVLLADRGKMHVEISSPIAWAFWLSLPRGVLSGAPAEEATFIQP